MYRKERVDNILKLLHGNGYVTVKFLCSELGYSKATVNRDLNYMQQQKMIVRSYGGVELTKKKEIPLAFRYHKMMREKKHICQVAADLVRDGDIIFIDSSTTTEYMAPYLINKRDITVITSNVAIVAYLSSHGVNTICLGGQVYEPPAMLGGDLAVKNAMEFKADKLFFSTASFGGNGEIGGGGGYTLLLNVMVKNSDEVIYLVDSKKINLPYKKVVMTLDGVDTVISDYCFPQALKNNFKNTEFIEI